LSEGEQDIGDIMARADESLAGCSLLVPVMRDGKRLPASNIDLDTIRLYAKSQIARLPDWVRTLAPTMLPYEVEVSPALASLQKEVAAQVGHWSRTSVA
jgi:nicotinate phosphoribosyltransferase